MIRVQQSILSAGLDEGLGIFEVDFAPNNLTLTIPDDAKVVDLINHPDTPTVFESTLTFSIVTGP
ncbi:hypothetical protein [Bacillus alkalicellulosilyticus]|uniref:hypothetical protein n=1 Tax=Alkalihalobacterium alkalicellulosilyticum TaxID=1912214 RepID=UPI000997ED1E|nr:hypothetical protein [Bacillus alkalicellulosilyticus]